MARAAQNHSEQLSDLMSTATEPNDSGLMITAFDLLRESVVPQLAVNCVLGPIEIRNTSLDIAWELSQCTGMPFMTADPIFASLIRDKNANFRIPAVDIADIPFEMTRIIFNSANNMEVGPLVFVMSRGASDNSGRVAAVMLAALCENFQAPVLFLDRGTEIPLPFEMLDWKEWLFNERDDVSLDGQSAVLGNLTGRSADSLTRAEWNELFATGEDQWEFIREQLSDICSEVFEDLEVNETFPVLKRYAIPTLQPKNELLDI